MGGIEVPLAGGVGRDGAPGPRYWWAQSPLLEPGERGETGGAGLQGEEETGTPSDPLPFISQQTVQGASYAFKHFIQTRTIARPKCPADFHQVNTSV